MKRVLFRVVTIITGCLLGVLATEFVLRFSNVWIGRHSDTMFTVIEHDEVLGWKMKPNINEKIDLVDVEGIPVRSNSLGFWDREFSFGKEPGKCRIAFLGDSFTWGMGAREEQRFSNLVAAANIRWESLNFGMPGFGTDQALLVWRYIAHRYRPDLVVLTIYKNDYVDNFSLVRYGRRKPYFELANGKELVLRGTPVEPTNFWHDGVYNQIAEPYESFFPDPIHRRPRLAHWLGKNFDIARSAYTLFRIYTARAQVDREGEAQGPTTESFPKPSPRLQTEIELLNAIVGELAKGVQAAEGKLIVVLSGDEIPQYLLQKEALRKAGIRYVDATTDALAKVLRGGRKDVYYRYSGHWTPSAYRAVGDLLIKSMRQSKACDGTS